MARNILRFGCIGCGGMGRLHMSNSKFVPGMQVVAYADLEEAKATEFLDRFGGEYATSDPYRVITDDSLDAVLIQTGPESHPVLGIAAAQAGKQAYFCGETSSSDNGGSRQADRGS